MAVMPAWWGGRDLRAMLPRIFFEHFRTTSFVAEHDDRLVGFLAGFLCPTHGDEAYIHFAGVDPAWRRAGLARDLYSRFCRLAQADGRTCVRAVTAVVNRDSITFHRRLGFELLPGDIEVDGLLASGDPEVPEGAIVRFELRLDDIALDLDRTASVDGATVLGLDRTAPVSGVDASPSDSGEEG
jgi:GNAT superfamily N-acetyltransferase